MFNFMYTEVPELENRENRANREKVLKNKETNKKL